MWESEMAENSVVSMAADWVDRKVVWWVDAKVVYWVSWMVVMTAVSTVGKLVD